MSFNPLKEKGIPLEKQLRSWEDITKRRFNKYDVDCYSRTRQILMNGIEVEAWNFKHAFSRLCGAEDTLAFLAMTKKFEDSQQTTINWMKPEDQTILETTLGYEQVAVDLTAWLAQNEPDDYVKETYNFGLLEDFDHLYRYSQWAYLEHGVNPKDIVQNMTDIVIGRPTQFHHNCNIMRLRKPYDKETAEPQTKVNILTLVSAEQQTHNYYAEHGMAYGNPTIRGTYAEIKDVEEEHVNMYESLIDPTESLYEKLLLHEFTEVCNYYTCYKDEDCDMMKPVWEEFLAMEIGHLHQAAKLFTKYDGRDAEEIIGDKVVIPSHFESQKEYVQNILENEVGKRITSDKGYTTVDELPEDWVGYKIQNANSKDGAPTETTIEVIAVQKGRDLTIADEKLVRIQPKLLEESMLEDRIAPNMISVEDYKFMTDKEFEF